MPRSAGAGGRRGMATGPGSEPPLTSEVGYGSAERQASGGLGTWKTSQGVPGDSPAPSRTVEIWGDRAGASAGSGFTISVRSAFAQQASSQTGEQRPSGPSSEHSMRHASGPALAKLTAACPRKSTTTMAKESRVTPSLIPKSGAPD